MRRGQVVAAMGCGVVRALTCATASYIGLLEMCHDSDNQNGSRKTIGRRDLVGRNQKDGAPWKEEFQRNSRTSEREARGARLVIDSPHRVHELPTAVL